MQIQREAKPPCAIIFQAEHSLLAGDLARQLRRDVFGDIPAEAIQASAEHDFGWEASDQAQMDSLRQHALRPFPAMSTEETLPSWQGSISHGRELSALIYVLISRHCTYLGSSDPSRADFVKTETERRSDIERDLPYAREDLNRWTAVLGFSDLLSLYLCSGLEDDVEFPVAHPADPNAHDFRKTTISWDNGHPRFSPPMLQAGAHVSLEARTYDGVNTRHSPLKLEWCFHKG